MFPDSAFPIRLAGPTRRRLPSTSWRWTRCLAPVALAALAGACEPPPSDFEDLAADHLATLDGEIAVGGLRERVEIFRDPWGVPHVYASNLDDLFFAQGFVQAQDRLWQMEMYRRAGEGRLAEILGPEAVEHDRLARLLRYRGPWDETEFGSYHPEGRRIVEAFTRGVNAYIEAGVLPVEFQLTGIRPDPWTPRASLLRMQTAMPLGDARRELRLARLVAEVGPEEANRRANLRPRLPLAVPEGVDVSIIGEEVAGALRGFRGSMARPELAAPYDVWAEATVSADEGAREDSPGSNNWALSPEITATGHAMVANDPHRAVTNPSLRYVVHLDAPGWTAIGSTEPVLPGVAIGHNGRVAWGLTIVGTDQSDVYVEKLNPENPREVRWRGGWEPLEVVVDTIPVKGEDSRVVELVYSRHGPVFHVDSANGVAYALRSTMHEPGTTGYLGALRLDVVDDCVEFLEELRYWKAPTENMVCGDAEGNIAWQASALTPARDGWLGRLPVPGDGGYEWTGFRDDLPRELNPERGWIATANHDIHPPGYEPPLYFKSRSTFGRYERLAEALSAAEDFTLADSKRLQLDAYSASADEASGLFRGWSASEPELEDARREIAEWDAVYRRSSRAAAIYYEMRRRIPEAVRDPTTSDEERRQMLEGALAEALTELREEQGPDPTEWRWGRTHRSDFPHSLVEAYDLPVYERSGGAGTVASTGATYRHVIDFADLDGSLATNAPGQSGRPGSPYYGNLAESWAAGEYFPLLFSRDTVEARAEHRLVLLPGG